MVHTYDLNQKVELKTKNLSNVVSGSLNKC